MKATRNFWQRLWGVTVRKPASNRTAVPATTESSIRWAELALDLEFSQLSRLRKVAEQWRTGMLSLTSLVGLVSVVKGVDTASKLEADDRSLLAVLMLVTFLMLVLGSIMSMRAAYGTIGPRELASGEALRWHEVQQAESVRLQLITTQILLVLATICLAAASAVTYAANPVTAAVNPPAATTPSSIPGDDGRGAVSLVGGAVPHAQAGARGAATGLHHGLFG